MPEHQAESILLHSETTVTLENIALSDILFSKLLEKTKVVVGENVSVFGNFNGEDCIRAGMDFEELCFLSPASFQKIENTPLFIENIPGIPNKSIKLGKVKRLELSLFAINILLKLVLHDENEMKGACLDAWNPDSISEMMRVDNNSIWLGKVKRLELRLFAVSILPKLKLHEESAMEEFCLRVWKSEHASEAICAENNSICLGKVRKLDLSLFAINILPKLKLHGANEMERVCLIINQEEHVSEIMSAKNNSIWLGKVKSLELSGYSVNALPKLALHKENEMEEFYLDADKEEYVSEVIRAENKTIWLGKVKNLGLWSYAINILPKLCLHEESVMERLYLHAWKTEHVSEVIRAENKNILLEKVKKLELCLFAVNIFPKLSLHKENVMERFYLNVGQEKYISEVIRVKNNSIWAGKIKKLELDLFAIKILPKLKLHKENEMEELYLNADKVEHVAEIILTENNSIWLGKVMKLELWNYAINAIPKLALHTENKMVKFYLNADKIEHVSEIILTGNSNIWLWKVNNLELNNCSVNSLPKLLLHEENVMEELVLNAPELEHVSEITSAENNSIHTRKLKNLKLWGYAINVLPKLHGENELGELVIADVDRGCCSNDVFSSDSDFCSWKIKRLKIENSAIDVLKIRKGQGGVLDHFEFVPRKEEKLSHLKARHFLSRIDIGKVREHGLFVPEKVGSILKYTLVDDEGNGMEKKKKLRTLIKMFDKSVCGRACYTLVH
ncbi:MAG: uncharacterized protein A8A55_1509 [Amphiamblys sp. WSBS2006]|nr:MAG: uncharacterized protein A8A55_1509 [Amphiamblys sp. WSBS2006]